MSAVTFIFRNSFHKKVASSAGYSIAYYGFGQSGGAGQVDAKAGGGVLGGAADSWAGAKIGRSWGAAIEGPFGLALGIRIGAL